MVKIFLSTLILVGVALLLFAVRILIKRGGTFHSQHVGQSKAMRDRGINCVQSADRIEHASKLNVNDMEK
ncbi:MAG: hypothetical protein E7069_13500 [Bacteroidales bacterium]|nr:hypothetical protein [Bacteroidales bacterium]